MQYINEENIFDYAFINTDALKLPMKAVCVDFHGYTDATMFSESPEMAKVFGEKGVAWVFPYYSVWAWMSRSSQEFIEQVLDAVYKKLQLPDTIPLIITGGSMGGLTALCYQVYGKRKAVACAANCPVTDMSLVFELKADMRRAILSAHILNEGSLEKILEEYSPIKLIDRLPAIPYLLIFGEKDEAITERFWTGFLEKMEAAGLDMNYIIQKDMVHCDIENHKETFDAWCNFVLTNAGVDRMD